MTMKFPAADAVQQALRPIASLIGKSEKARRKLAPDTWQHAMLRDNLKALRIASALMNKTAVAPGRWTGAELRAALKALASMIRKTRQAQVRFSPGTSQHTLLRNRLKALRVARTLVLRSRNLD